ncbi:hypothetical protein F3Y22_tig00002799pilonHSYRG00132 [Hibiscus syriacus]|uniref:BRX domain-containing protein n=1 Tax=Hibiscus syriacus TaxID=106335 RepID=A0A6A3CW49_HIBSY|nr:hypothetical protein F3Y22_tig00002799pilonHSYRG00132 [Hibiscus syriacus]
MFFNFSFTEQDETTLIWLSRGEEKTLKLSLVSRIIPGQRTAVLKDICGQLGVYHSRTRTAVFKRYLRPEKEYLSFSLIYNNGDRSLDLICKDKAEAEVWLAGLKALIGQSLNRRADSDLSDLQEGYFFRNGYPALDFTSSISSSKASIDFRGSDAGAERANMQSNGGDGVRLSVSSAPSCSSSGSAGPDDIESLGEVFTLDEEHGGRLGHGTEKDLSRPQLVEFLALTNVEFVASGECHTCAVSTCGDLFTWDDGTHNTGILGHGTDVSHWIPKRVLGTIEGLQVLSIACGAWHSALATSDGKLFTFGDGKFGVLGHGDRESVPYPKQVQMLSGLKTVRVACGVWHTAAIVEVMCQTGANISSRKLFTWGDGDKHRLGHGRHVFTMGGTAYGQLGNPSSDGKLPCLVQEKLVGEFVEEISCGAYHVAVLTSRSEVFTWGRGAKLGHGDIEDRKTPTLGEALRDKHVKNIPCGSNFTSSICIHKWISGIDHSKKALKKALAPTPGKPHSVCDSCYAKLKAAEAGNTSSSVFKPSPPPSPPHLSPINLRSSLYSSISTPPCPYTTPFSKNIKSMKHRSDAQDGEILELQKFTQQSTSYAAKESSKSKEAQALVKFITDQLVEIKEKLSPEVSESETFKAMQTRAEALVNRLETSEASSLPASSESSPMEGNVDASRSSESSVVSGGGKEITEQFESGVYITYSYHSNGVEIFKRVGFSSLNNRQKNKDRVFMRYMPTAIKPAAAVSSPTSPPVADETGETASSQTQSSSNVDQ